MKRIWIRSFAVKLKAAYEPRQICIRSTYRFSEQNSVLQLRSQVWRKSLRETIHLPFQLLAMMFGQLSNRESLRDLIVAFEAHRAKQYHLGWDAIL